MVAIYFSIIALIGIFANVTNGNLSQNITAHLSILYVFIFITTSRAFKAFHSPLSAPHSIMLPATRSEKFWAIALIEIVAVPLAFIISLIAAVNIIDGLFASYTTLPSLKEYIPTLDFSIDFTEDGKQKVFSYGLSVIPFLFSVIYFIFFAVYFRRAQFWIGCAVNVAVTASWVLITIFYVRGFTPEELGETMMAQLNAARYIVVITPVIMLWLAHRKFKRLQIKR